MFEILLLIVGRIPTRQGPPALAARRNRNAREKTPLEKNDRQEKQLTVRRKDFEEGNPKKKS